MSGAEVRGVKTEGLRAGLTAMLARLVDELPASGPGPAELRDLRRVLYGHHAVLRLHFAQEDESYLSLFESGPPSAGQRGGTR